MGEVSRKITDARLSLEDRQLTLPSGLERVPLTLVGTPDSRFPVLGRAGERELAVCRVGDTFYAVDNMCTHAFAFLAEGEIDGYELVCPLHAGSFDIRTGEPTAPPCTEAVGAYRVVEVDGALFIEIDGHTSAES